MGFIEHLRNTLQMQKEQELTKKKRANNALEAQLAADERATKRARECLEASSFPRLARELSEFIGAGVHIDTQEVAGRLDNCGDWDEEAAHKVEPFYSREEGSTPRRIKPYIRMEINWEYEPPLVHGQSALYNYKHIGIHFEEDWKIHVIGGPYGTTTLSKNKWHGNQREQEKALEKAYLQPANRDNSGYSIHSFTKRYEKTRIK